MKGGREYREGREQRRRGEVAEGEKGRRGGGKVLSPSTDKVRTVPSQRRKPCHIVVVVVVAYVIEPNPNIKIAEHREQRTEEYMGVWVYGCMGVYVWSKPPVSLYSILYTI
jgi:hypothetical protein